MSKYVFKNIDIKDLGKPVFITPVDYTSLKKMRKDALAQENIENVDNSLVGQNELLEEIKKKQAKFEEEKLAKENELEIKVKEIRDNAENWAFDKINEANKNYDNKIKEAEDIYNKKIKEAEDKAKLIIKSAENELEDIKKKSGDIAYKEAYEIGYSEGKDEMERIVGRLNNVISSAVNKRNLIIDEAESQLIDLVISIARKVVKTITEEQKRVVYDNVVESLKMLKGQTEITIRVNIEDLQMTTLHKKEFIDMVESIEHVKILEDNTIDKGGCIITSEFGSIDARIVKQLSNIEQQITKLKPVVDEG